MPNESAFDDASAYEGYVGRWSREVAKAFIDWLAVPPDQIWLDLGAGTGIVTDVILRQARPKQVIGVDTSAAYIEMAQKRINDPRAQFLVGDASDFDFSARQFDVSVSGLLLNFVASPQQVVHNTVRLIRPHGWVAAYVWDYAGKMEMMRYFWDAILTVDPAAIELDPGKLFTICHPDALKALFEDAGLQAVEVIPIDIPGVFQNFDDYWQPFFGAQGSVSKYLRSLNPEKRQALYAQLQAQLPFEADGTIHLTMRAWAVKGRVVAG